MFVLICALMYRGWTEGGSGVKVISDFPCFPLSDSRMPIYYLQLFSVITQLTVHLVFRLSHCGNMACCSTTVSWFLNSPLGQTSSVEMLALYSRRVNNEGNNGEGEAGFLQIHRLGDEQSCISMKTKCEVVNYRKIKHGGKNGGAAWVSLVLWCVYTKGCKWIQDGVWSQQPHHQRVRLPVKSQHCNWPLITAGKYARFLWPYIQWAYGLNVCHQTRNQICCTVGYTHKTCQTVLSLQQLTVLLGETSRGPQLGGLDKPLVPSEFLRGWPVCSQQHHRWDNTGSDCGAQAGSREWRSVIPGGRGRL